MFILNPGRFASSSPTDDDFSSVVFLMNMAGTNGGTDAVDLSDTPHTMTYGGDAQLSNAQTLYQSTSLLMDGDADRVTTPFHADFDPAGGAYTAEIRFRLSALSTNPILFGLLSTPGFDDITWYMQVRNDGTLRLVLSTTGAEETVIDRTASITTGTDYEAAWDVDGSGNLRVYLDGTQLGATETGLDMDLYDNTVPFVIGAQSSQGAEYLDGYVYEVRLTKGVQRYGGSYTPTSATYPTS